MSSIDDRIVNMHFDNAKFEKGVAESINSIENLKVSLKNIDGTSVSFEKLQNAANGLKLDSISEHAETIASKFNVMGVVGATAIAKLTSGVMDFVANGLGKAASKAKEVWDAISGGGMERAQNIEKAKFTVEGLGASFEKLQGSIDAAVQDTAYGFDEAAMAASQFLATGVKEGDDMTRALTSISGLAAMTSSSYGDIARIMTTVAGNGRLMGQQLNEIGSRGVNAAATLRDYFNKSEESMSHWRDVYNETRAKTKEPIGEGVELTEQNVRDMVSQGVIDFSTFSNAMYEAFGEHAKDAQQTFTGASANVTAALKRIGADFKSVTISSDDYKKTLNEAGKVDFTKETFNQINVLNELRNVLKGLQTELKNAGFVKMFTDIYHTISRGMTFFLHGFMDPLNTASNVLAPELREALQNIKDALSNVFNFVVGIASSISNAWKAIFPESLNQTILNITKGIKDFTSMLPQIGNANQALSNIFGIPDISGLMGDNATATEQAGEQITETAEEIAEAYDGVTGSLRELTEQVINGDFGNGEDRIAALGDSYQQVQDAVNSCYDAEGNLHEDWINNIDETIRVGEQLNETLSETEANTNVSEADAKYEEFKETLKETVPVASELGLEFEGLRVIFQGFFSMLNLGRKAISGIVEIGKRFVLPVASRIIEVIGEIAATIMSFVTALDRATPSQEQFNGALDVLASLLKPLWDAFYGITQGIIDFAKALRNGENPLKIISNGIANITEKLFGVRIDLGKILEPVLNYLKPYTNKIKELFDSVVQSFTSFTSELVSRVQNGESVYSVLRSKLEPVVEYLGPFGSTISNLFSGIQDGVKAFFKSIFSITENMSDPFSNLKKNLESFKELISNGFESFKSGFLAEGIKSIFEFIGEMIRSGIEGLVTLIGTLATTIFDSIKSVFLGISKTAKNTSELSGEDNAFGLSGVTDSLNETASGIAGPIDIITGSLSTLAIGLRDNAPVIWGYMAVISASLSAWNISKAIRNLTDPIGSLKKIPEEVGGILKSISKSITSLTDELRVTVKAMRKAVDFRIVADGIKQIAIAIAILAASLVVLGSMDPQVLQRGGIALGVLSAGLIALVAAFKKLDSVIKSGSTFKIAAAMLGITMSLMLMVTAMRSISKFVDSLMENGQINYEKLFVVFGLLVGLSAIILGMQYVLSKLQSSTLKSAASILIVAAGLLIMSRVMKNMASMSWGDIGKSIVSMISIVGILLGLMYALSEFEKAGRKVHAGKISALLISFSLSMYGIAKAMSIFSDISWEGVAKSIVSLIATLSIFIGALAVLSTIQKKLSGLKLAAIGASMIELALSMLIISAAMHLLAAIPSDSFGQALAGILALMLGMAALSKLLSTMKGITFPAAGILMMAVAIGILTASLAAISFLPNLDNAMHALSMLVIDLMALGLVASKVSSKLLMVGPALIMVAAAVGVLAGSLYLISRIQNLESSLDTISMLMIGLMFLGLVGSMVSSKILVAGAGLILMAGAVALLGFTLQMLSGIDVGNMWAAVGAIGALALILVVLGVVFDEFALGGVIVIAALLALSVAMIAFGVGALLFSVAISIAVAAFAMLIGIASNVEGINALTVAITMLAEIAPQLIVLGIGAIIAGAGIVVLGLGMIVLAAGAALGALALNLVVDALTRLGEFASGDGFKAIIENFGGFVALAALFVVLSVAIIAVGLAAIVLGAGATIAGAGLMIFGAGAMVAAAGVMMLGAAVAFALTVVSAAIVAFAQAGYFLMVGLAQGLADGASILFNTLGSIVTGAIDFVKGLFGINSPSVVFEMIGKFCMQGLGLGVQEDGSKPKEALKNVTADMVSQASEMPAEFKAIGSESAQGYAEGLSNMPAFASKITDKVNSVVKDGGQAAGEQGGDATAQGFLEGTSVISPEMQEQMKSLGFDIEQFTSGDLSNIARTGFGNVGEAASQGMAEKIAQNSESADEARIQVDAIADAAQAEVDARFPEIGINAMAKINEGFMNADLGTTLLEGMTASMESANQIGVELANSIKTGFESVPLTEAATAKVNEFVMVFSTALEIGSTVGTQFANTVKQGLEGVNFTVSGSMAGMQYIAGITATMQGGFAIGFAFANSVKLGASSVSMSSAGTSLGQQFISGLTSYMGMAFTVGWNLGTTARAGAESVNMSSAGIQNAMEFCTGLASFIGMALFNGLMLGNSARSGAESVDMAPSGSQNASEFVSGVNSQSGEAYNAGYNLGQSAADGARDSSGGMYGIGVNIGEGLSSGISSMVSSVAASAANLVTAAMNAAREAGAIHSPSRKFIEIGHYMGEGLVIGVRDYMSQAADAGGAIGDAAIDAVNETVEKMVDVLESDLDAAPTIRPVLDDSELKRGLHGLNRTMADYGMGGSYAMGLANNMVGTASFGSGYSESGLAKAIAEELLRADAVGNGDTNITFNAYGADNPQQYARETMSKVSQIQRAR